MQQLLRFFASMWPCIFMMVGCTNELGQVASDETAILDPNDLTFEVTVEGYDIEVSPDPLAPLSAEELDGTIKKIVLSLAVVNGQIDDQVSIVKLDPGKGFTVNGIIIAIGVKRAVEGTFAWLPDTEQPWYDEWLAESARDIDKSDTDAAMREPITKPAPVCFIGQLMALGHGSGDPRLVFFGGIGLAHFDTELFQMDGEIRTSLMQTQLVVSDDPGERFTETVVNDDGRFLCGKPL